MKSREAIGKDFVFFHIFLLSISICLFCIIYIYYCGVAEISPNSFRYIIWSSKGKNVLRRCAYWRSRCAIRQNPLPGRMPFRLALETGKDYRISVLHLYIVHANYSSRVKRARCAKLPRAVFCLNSQHIPTHGSYFNIFFSSAKRPPLEPVDILIISRSDR